MGVVTWELRLGGCQTLKDKRRVVTSLKDRLHAKFNVAVAETAHQDSRQLAELSCCAVSNSRRHTESVLTAADNLVQRHPGARIVESQMSLL